MPDGPPWVAQLGEFSGQLFWLLCFQSGFVGNRLIRFGFKPPNLSAFKDAIETSFDFSWICLVVCVSKGKHGLSLSKVWIMVFLNLITVWVLLLSVKVQHPPPSCRRFCTKIQIKTSVRVIFFGFAHTITESLSRS